MTRLEGRLPRPHGAALISSAVAVLAGAVLFLGCADAPEHDDTPPAQALTDDELPEDLKGGRYALAPELSEEQRLAIEQLNSLGYADGTQVAPEVVSVTRHEAGEVFEGYNLYTSGHGTEALLIDMDGAVLHRWSYDYDELWPDLDVPAGAAGRGKWRRTMLFPNGDLLAIHEGIGMLKLDRDSNLLWEYPGHAHHDAHILADGSIWTLAREAKVIPRVHESEPSMDDFLVELAPDGTERQRISVLECLERGDGEELLARMKRGKELFHTNSIEVLDGRLAERLPAFAAGNLLVSLRHLDAICVIDPREAAVVWSMTGDFRAQHDPTVLDNGNLLLFDNRGAGEASTVREFDPVTGEPVWAYAGTAESPFYSHTCGTSYRLPNGNTLVSESDAGRAFELTPDKRIVWEFYNPHRGGPELQYIAVLYDLQRVLPEDVSWLED